MTNDQLSAEIKTVRKDLTSLKSQIDPYKSGGRKIVTQTELNKAESNLKKMQMEWKKKKRGCTEVTDQISESVKMNRKGFIEKIGLETDEENKVLRLI